MKKLIAGAAGGVLVFAVMMFGVLAPTLGNNDAAAAVPASCAPAGAGGTLKGGVPVPADVLALIGPAVAATGASPLTEAVLAAQLYQESQFNPNAVSPVGAQGIAQFMPATWATWGRDENGDGAADPLDPQDAIPAAARYDTAIAGQVAAVGGDPVANMLAAYNAGPGRVLEYGGVPPFAETQAYVQRITDLASQWSAAPPADGSTVAALDAEQLANVQTIVAATTRAVRSADRAELNRAALDQRAAVIAVTAALAESKLDDTGATGAGLGLYRMDPTGGWGTPEQVTDPEQATDAFLAMMLRAVPSWRTATAGAVANAVLLHNRPASDYAQYEPDATAAVGVAIGNPNAGVQCTGGTGVGDGAPPSAKVQAALKAAESQLGLPYIWGGGNAAGPTGGGFDCSGLMIYAWAQVGVTLPHSSALQYNYGTRVPIADAQPGDLIFLAYDGSSPSQIHHVAMVYAPGQIIEAQQTGVPVHIRSYKGAAEGTIMPFAVRLAA